MNKSKKLLLPAVALLTISVAAAATSTIAWFASSNLANVNVSNIIAKTEGNLTATYQTNSNYGCVSTNAFTTLVNGLNIDLNPLRDASLDLNGEQVSCVERKKNVDGSLATGYNKITTSFDSKDEKALTYYYARIDFYFKISSTLEAGQNYGIFFKSEELTSTVSIASALRVGFRQIDHSYCVWAPYYNTTSNTGSATALKYANATTGGSYQYSKTGLTPGDKAFSSHTVTDASVATDSNYIGTIDSTNNAANGLLVSAYIWFEGEDVDCVSDKISANAINNLPLTFVSVAL